MTNSKECRARVEFHSPETVELAGGDKIYSLQGVFTCTYPIDVCQKEDREDSGFITRIIRERCALDLKS